MKKEIFISYSDFDKDKVQLIRKELEQSILFSPLIIASNREALKLLVAKVVEGIKNADVIVPILTKNSISTQWLNQEIGFASALNKKIMPIVEKEIIGILKGFIHKEIDLPYSFQTSTNKAKEHKDFINCFRTLISDLEGDKNKIKIKVEAETKSEFQKSLEKAEIINQEVYFQEKTKEFIRSNEAVKVASEELTKIIFDIEIKSTQLAEKKFHFAHEKSNNPPSFINKLDGFSFSVAWQQPYFDSNEDAFLYVRLWKGYISNKSDYL